MAESRRKQLFPEVTDEQWNDWKWQVKNRIETLEDLKKYVKLTAEEEEGVKKDPLDPPHGHHSLLFEPHRPERPA